MFLIAAVAVVDAAREWYSVDDFARLVDKAPFTVRQWANLGRIRATKALTRCGLSQEWRISHAELERYQREGLLPVKRSA